MTAMEHSTISTPPAAVARGPQTDDPTDERYIPHFRSLITPGVASGPLLPEWLRKRFRRKDTPR
jgi:hypothetical protein